MISPVIPTKPWFYNLPLSRSQIGSFSRLRSSHSLLPVHAFRLSLNISPVCPRHEGDVIYDFTHLNMDCPALDILRCQFFSFLLNNSYKIHLMGNIWRDIYKATLRSHYLYFPIYNYNGIVLTLLMHSSMHHVHCICLQQSFKLPTTM